ncbi:C6 zinc finger domain protein [Penicillium robsamsonii]|uniref:C6 zinc finger domain protein n=1 Tax=Penicillium robsamsonii TaxID=1792511 RepID=UPI0025469669|nr:C6 zinc finger domain protein [Penicillium robsamsonii]KAJ5823863.1 C6 zinc finger domain protein [Penicillium robsamsonii]
MSKQRPPFIQFAVGNVDLSASHPTQVQIFRLWQIYLDNVNPLLRVTHTPTLQTRIIDAASDIANINPTMEALMFGMSPFQVSRRIIAVTGLDLPKRISWQAISLHSSKRYEIVSFYVPVTGSP